VLVSVAMADVVVVDAKKVNLVVVVKTIAVALAKMD